MINDKFMANFEKNAETDETKNKNEKKSRLWKIKFMKK